MDIVYLETGANSLETQEPVSEYFFRSVWDEDKKVFLVRYPILYAPMILKFGITGHRWARQDVGKKNVVRGGILIPKSRDTANHARAGITQIAYDTTLRAGKKSLLIKPWLVWSRNLLLYPLVYMK